MPKDIDMSYIGKKWGAFDVEVPSWGFSRGGTRFGAYPTENDPRTVADRIAKAAKFHKLTGKGKKVALHFPWDGRDVKEVEDLVGMLCGHGLQAGAVNANFFSQREGTALDDRLRFGGLISPFEDVYHACMAHVVECIEYMQILGSETLILWLPDGINSPGQMSFFEMMGRLGGAFKEIGKMLNNHGTLMIEYKPFEPAFYASAIPDWGSALYFCTKAGENAKVLVDLGHHLQGANVEQIVAFLMQARRFGGFHFNDSKYADDDLASGSLNPAELFRIFTLLVESEDRVTTDIFAYTFMIDESHNIKDPLEEMIESQLNIEQAYMKALLVDMEALDMARASADPMWADDILRDAFLTDVRPMMEEFRSMLDLPPDPLKEVFKERRQGSGE